MLMGRAGAVGHLQKRMVVTRGSSGTPAVPLWRAPLRPERSPIKQLLVQQYVSRVAVLVLMFRGASLMAHDGTRAVLQPV